VGGGEAGEQALRYLDRAALVLAERADRGAAEVRAVAVAPVAGERAVDHLELAAAVEDRAAPAAVDQVAGRVAVGEGEVLNGQLGPGLVLAVRGGPVLVRVAGVQVQDPPCPAAP